mgnify:CR=1 FL=1
MLGGLTASNPSQDSKAPSRETETQKEFQNLLKVTGSLEHLGEQLGTRLQGFLGQDLESPKDTAKSSENSSQFAKELNSINNRLSSVAVFIQQLLDRLET